MRHWVLFSALPFKHVSLGSSIFTRTNNRHARVPRHVQPPFTPTVSPNQLAGPVTSRFRKRTYTLIYLLQIKKYTLSYVYWDHTNTSQGYIDIRFFILVLLFFFCLFCLLICLFATFVPSRSWNGRLLVHRARPLADLPRFHGRYSRLSSLFPFASFFSSFLLSDNQRKTCYVKKKKV